MCLKYACIGKISQNGQMQRERGEKKSLHVAGIVHLVMFDNSFHSQCFHTWYCMGFSFLITSTITSNIILKHHEPSATQLHYIERTATSTWLHLQNDRTQETCECWGELSLSMFYYLDSAEITTSPYIFTNTKHFAIGSGTLKNSINILPSAFLSGCKRAVQEDLC